jgi:hypothetical protein
VIFFLKFSLNIEKRMTYRASVACALLNNNLSCLITINLHVC